MDRFTQIAEDIMKLSNSELYKVKEIIEHEIMLSETCISEGQEERK